MKTRFHLSLFFNLFVSFVFFVVQSTSAPGF